MQKLKVRKPCLIKKAIRPLRAGEWRVVNSEWRSGFEMASVASLPRHDIEEGW